MRVLLIPVLITITNQVRKLEIHKSVNKLYQIKLVFLPQSVNLDETDVPISSSK